MTVAEFKNSKFKLMLRRNAPSSIAERKRKWREDSEDEDTEPLSDESIGDSMAGDDFEEWVAEKLDSIVASLTRLETLCNQLSIKQ